MGLSDWLRKTHTAVRDTGLRRGLSDGTYELYRGSWRIFGSRLPVGTNVFDRDWDVLIVLDACRVDMLREVRKEYPFLQKFHTTNSVGSHSREWLAKTFCPEYAAEIGRTAYITGNVFSDQTFRGGGEEVAKHSPFSPDTWDTVSADAFDHLEEAWQDTWNDNHGTVLPRDITDRGIDTWRSRTPERMILHYMQPHLPFVNCRDTVKEEVSSEYTFPEMNLQRLRRGKLRRSDFELGYRANLRRVLDDVSLLLNSIDADTVVLTADHGEALGEWGIYGHPIGFLHPSVKTVPWVVTSAEDRGEYVPSVERQTTRAGVNERLEALGYRK